MRSRVPLQRNRSSSSKNVVVFLSQKAHGSFVINLSSGENAVQNPRKRSTSSRCVLECSGLGRRQGKSATSSVMGGFMGNYWSEKERIQKKYEVFFHNLKEEELAEIKHCIGKSQNVGDDIMRIKEYYEEITGLIMSQKLVEEEEMIKKYKQNVVGAVI